MAINVETYEKLSQAVNALAKNDGARYFGGGTFIMRSINNGEATAATVIRTTDQSLHQVRTRGTRIDIGAGITMAEVLGNRDLEFLHKAASCVGGPSVQNMATVGGNLFARTPYGDFTVAMLAMDALVTLAGAAQQREVSLASFLENIDQHRGEVVVSLSVERPPTRDALRFLKISRVKPKRAAVITLAAHLPLVGGRIQNARIAYGAMAPRPMRAIAVERALEGKTLDRQSIDAAVAVAIDGCSPATDPISTNWYRLEVAPVYLKRLLLGTPE